MSDLKYDFGVEDDPRSDFDFDDPTRSRWFDFTEASMLNRHARARISRMAYVVEPELDVESEAELASEDAEGTEAGLTDT